MDPVNLPYYDFMVDIETTGTSPDRNAVIQLAAVAFDWERGRVGPSFCVNVSMPAWRSWCEDTRGWWASQSPEVFLSVTENPVHPFEAARAFVQWVRNASGALESPRMWAKPAWFDFPFLASLLKDADLDNPFHFRDAVDMQSFIRGTRYNPKAPAFDREVPFVGDAHNALDDVYHQIRVALMAKSRFVNPQGGYDAQIQAQEQNPTSHAAVG